MMKDTRMKKNTVGLPAIHPPKVTLCDEDEEEIRQQCFDLYVAMSAELLSEGREGRLRSSGLGPS